MIDRQELIALLDQQRVMHAGQTDPQEVLSFREALADAVLALPAYPEGEKSYHLTDDELDSIRFRLYHDPDGTPTSVQLAIGDKLTEQFEQQGGYESD